MGTGENGPSTFSCGDVSTMGMFASPDTAPGTLAAAASAAAAAAAVVIANGYDGAPSSSCAMFRGGSGGMAAARAAIVATVVARAVVGAVAGAVEVAAVVVRAAVHVTVRAVVCVAQRTTYYANWTGSTQSQGYIGVLHALY
eukprot:IDg12934t1